MPRVRFDGARARVAMGDADWQRFTTLPDQAVEKLTIVLEHVCARGREHLPRGLVRVSAPGTDGSGRRISFEAHGVVLQGRLATMDGADAIFITTVQVDPDDVAPPPGRTRSRDGRQGELQLLNIFKGGQNGAED